MPAHMANWDHGYALQVVRFLALHFGASTSRYPHERTVLGELVDDDAGIDTDCDAIVRVGDGRWPGRLTWLAHRTARFVPCSPLPSSLGDGPVMLELRPPGTSIIVHIPSRAQPTGGALALTFVGAPVSIHQRRHAADRVAAEHATRAERRGGARR